MSQHDHPTSPAADVRDLVEDDTTCTKCGYNLRMLPRTGNCPECGLAVVESSPGKPHHIPRKFRYRTLLRCYAVVGIPLLLASITTALFGYFVLWGFSRRMDGVPATIIFYGLANIVLLMWTFNTVPSKLHVGFDRILGRPDKGEVQVRLRREGIGAVLESRLGLRIKDTSGVTIITVAREIEGFDEIRDLLNQWVSITPDTSILGECRFHFYAWTLALTIFNAPVFSANPLIIGAACTTIVFAGITVVALGIVRRQTRRVERLLITAIGVFIILIGVVIMLARFRDVF